MSTIQQEAHRSIADSSRTCTSPFACLRGIAHADAIRIVSRVVYDMQSLKLKKERINYICSAIARSFAGYTPKGYASMNWTIGTNPFLQSNCCRFCFMHFYGIGNTSLTKYCALMKHEKQHMPSFTDKCAPYIYHELFKGALDDMAHRVGIQLNHRQIAALQIPNSRKVMLYV